MVFRIADETVQHVTQNELLNDSETFQMEYQMECQMECLMECLMECRRSHTCDPAGLLNDSETFRMCAVHINNESQTRFLHHAHMKITGFS